jgi:hypothetical protein
MVELIYYVNKEELIDEQFNIESNFANVSDITIMSLKLYYLNILSLLRDNYQDVYNYFQNKYKKDKKSFIKITTNDSHTLTDGPTIFITDNVRKLGLFYLKVSNIPESELDDIVQIINRNERSMLELEKIEKDEEQRKDKLGSEQLDKDHSKNTGMYTPTCPSSDEFGNVYLACKNSDRVMKDKAGKVSFTGVECYNGKWIPNEQVRNE